MKRLLTIAIGLVTIFTTITADDVVSINNFKISAGETKEISIELSNEETYVGFQFDLQLPAGFSVEEYNADRGRLPESTTLSMSKLTDGSYRFMAVAMNSEAIIGSTGSIVSLIIKASESLASGELSGSFRNIKLSRADGTGEKYSKMLFPITLIEPSVVTVKSISREYGEANPPFEYSVTGGVLEGEPTITCDASAISAVGEYTITIAKGSVMNYNVTFVNGILTVSKAPLIISTGTYYMKQGDPLPEFTLSYSGFKNNETKEVLTKQPTVSYEATSASEPGKYDIVVSGAEAQNYEISYVKGTLTINEADPVKVTAKSYTIKYGDAIPEFEFTSSGAELSGTPVITCEASSTSPVGTYPIVISKGSVTNYNDSYVNGVLTITKAPLTISVGDYEKKQYDPMPEFVVSYEGFKNDETEDVFTKQPVLSCEANEDSAPGEYVIRVTGADAENYEIQYVAGKLTVTEPDSYTLTYMVDGEEYQSFIVKYRETITPLEAPTKEGYTFSGWSEIPETMPANDVTVTGTFSINSYTLTYIVDGEVYQSFTIKYRDPITPLEAPEKEGYTFSGWDGLPRSMPAKDVVVKGSFTINKYKLTYMVDGEVYKTSSVAYGTTLTPETTPEKEGYTFSGWSVIPETMPANDVMITGSFTINKYKLTYMVDGVEYKSYEINYSATITPEAAPIKEGYTFSGWSEIPETMPANDVTVIGTFSINSYTLTYMVDGEVYKTSTVAYGTTLTPETTPEKEGYTFSGWSEIPETMPAKDVTVTGAFSINSYTLTYMVDGEVYKTSTVVFGTTLTPEAEPTKEGYTFSGWSEIPATMPAKDVTVIGTFTINSYTLTYIVDGEEYKSFTVKFREAITPLEAPTKEGYTFSGWDGLPRSMPAHDVVVKGSFSINKYKLTYMVDGVEYKSYDINYATAITPETEPTKEGYTFSGWSEIPESMPANDVVVTGTFTVNSYIVRFMYRDEVLYTEEVYYGAPIPLPELYDDYGLLIKWLDVPETMPDHDIVILVDETDTVLNIHEENKDDIKIYDLNGHRLASPQKGINIIRYSDGTSRKVLIK